MINQEIKEEKKHEGQRKEENIFRVVSLLCSVMLI